MGLEMTDRIALFIDGANLHTTVKNLGFEVDFRRLLTEFGKHGQIVRAYFYTVVRDDDEFSSLRPLVDWLDYNGYAVRRKAAKQHDDGDGRRRMKRSIGIELAVDAMEIAHRIDQAFLFSGDGDLRAVVEAVRRMGVRVTVVSSIRTKPPMIADELRRHADAFVELESLRPSIERPAHPIAPE